MEQSQNNIYLKLQGLIWSAFLGVLSFQIIVPIAWEYLNLVLNIRFQQGYFTFVTIYALLVPASFAIWLFFHHKELKACLFPIDSENDIDSICKIFIVGLGVSLLCQVTLTLFFTFVNKFNANNFWVFQILCFVTSFILLLMGGFISRKRILQFATKTLSRQGKEIKQKAIRILFGFALFSMLIIGFVFAHWHANKKNYHKETKEYIEAGFSLLDTRKKMDTLIKEVNYVKDNLTWKRNQKSTDSLARNSTGVDTLLTKAKYKTSSVSISMLDTILKTDQNLSDSDLKKLGQFFAIKKDLLLKMAQKVIGKQLRDTQLKLTYLLLNTFLILIALLVFLQIDYLIKEYECAEPAHLAKRYPDHPEFHETFLKREGIKNAAQGLAGRIWLFVGIAVWLIVPLFKPVEDEKIASNAPFKMLTFSRPDQPWNSPPIQTENCQVSNSFNNTIDSLLVRINNQYPQTVSPPDLSKIDSALQKIMYKLDTIKGQNNTIKAKVKYLTPN
jgi:hypothetical protein